MNHLGYCHEMSLNLTVFWQVSPSSCSWYLHELPSVGSSKSEPPEPCLIALITSTAKSGETAKHSLYDVASFSEAGSMICLAAILLTSFRKGELGCVFS